MTSNLKTLQESWSAQWPAALVAWSRFTKLSEPRWCFTHAEAEREGLTQSFAMIRLNDHVVVIDLQGVAEAHIEPFALEVLAHEVGHHVYAPADLSDNARMIARMRWALPTKESLAGFIANLYTDLLINDRLQRSANLSMAKVYQTLGNQSSDPMWTLYMRIYEILWSLTKGTLATGEIEARLEGDAHLGARLVRSYAKEWLDGAGRFAALCLPYVMNDDAKGIQQILQGWRDMQGAGQGGMPHGLSEVEEGEIEGALHPALDPELSGVEGNDDDQAEAAATPKTVAQYSGSQGQTRQPFQFGEILRSMGINLSDHDIAVRYYKERAAPHLIRFPSRILPESTDPLPEGLEAWDLGAPLENVDWFQSVLLSPRIFPGLTTMQRVWGTTEGGQPQKEPLDLDLYVDSSGSMPNPQSHVSYLTLAGAIIALSALRVGASVQATLWSGKKQFKTTDGFVRDETLILKILTGYFGGATAFPIHILRDTFAQRKPTAHPAHILIISDDGVTTMFDNDEKGNSGWDVARMALDKARGGGTMVLNLVEQWEQYNKEDYMGQSSKNIRRARAEQGWNVHRIGSWEELVAFARWFSQMKYSES